MNLNFRDFAIFLDYDMVDILSRVFKEEESMHFTRSML